MAAPSDRGAEPDIPGERLGEAVERHMLAPFRWGASDCASAVCAVLVDMGHPDPFAPWRGAYSDEDGARAVGRVEDRAAESFAALGWPEIDPETAEDCDVGVYGNSLAIRCGGRWALKSLDGYVTKPRVRRAWRPA